MSRPRMGWVEKAIRRARLYDREETRGIEVKGAFDRLGRQIRHGQHVFIRRGTHHHQEARVMGATRPPFNLLLVVDLYVRGERSGDQRCMHTVPSTSCEVIVE